MRRFFILPLFGFGELSLPSAIADAGIMPCASLLKFPPVTARPQPEVLAWLQGYISGLNQERAKRGEKVGRDATALTLEVQRAFSVSYCPNNSPASLADAASALYQELPVLEFKR